MVGTLSAHEIDDVLHLRQVARLACCLNNRPYIVPINYAFNGYCIYARTHAGMKLDIMRKNPSVCIEVEEIETPTNWRTVVAWGRFEEVTDIPEREKALTMLHNRSVISIAGENFRFTEEWPFKPDDMNVVEGVVYKIVLEEKTGRFETR